MNAMLIPILALACLLGPTMSSTARDDAHDSASVAASPAGHVVLPENVLDATFARYGIDYHLLVGEFETTTVPNTKIQLHRPVGPGIHVLEIGWAASRGKPQSITVPSVGQVFVNEAAIYVDFQSTDHTVFTAASGWMPATCDGTYTKVLSVTTAGGCWGAREVSDDGTESRKCNATGTACTATITFDVNPPQDPVHPVFKCDGGGSIDFNPTTHIAHANKADDGTC